MLNRRHIRIKILQAFYAYFQSENDDLVKGEKELMHSMQRIYDLYLYMLQLFVAIKRHANIKIEEDYKLIPKGGVYAVNVVYSNIFYKGMLNIGRRPTISSNNELTIEVNIFDFNKSIYGDHLKLEIIQRVRNEIHFTDVNGLKAQLKQDLNDCKKILSLK